MPFSWWLWYPIPSKWWTWRLTQEKQLSKWWSSWMFQTEADHHHRPARGKVRMKHWYQQKTLARFSCSFRSLVTHLLGLPGSRIPSGGNWWSSSRSASRWGSLERRMPILRLKIGVEGKGYSGPKSRSNQIQWQSGKDATSYVTKCPSIFSAGRGIFWRSAWPSKLQRYGPWVLPMVARSCVFKSGVSNLSVKLRWNEGGSTQESEGPTGLEHPSCWVCRWVSFDKQGLFTTIYHLSLHHWICGFCGWISKVGQRAKKPIERWSWAFFASETSRFFGKS